MSLNHDFVQLSANGSTVANNIPIDGEYVFFAFGTFGGGTVTFEASPDSGTTWLSLGTLTADGRASYYLSAKESVRTTLSGATTPTIDSGVR